VTRPRLEEVKQRIVSAGGDLDRVTIVAVTKGFGPEAARAAVEAGLTDIGENYAQELVAKADAVDGARWHFLGHVQRNKLSSLVPHVTLWHGIDRISIGEALVVRSPGAAVLVQVNVTDDDNRNGCRRDEVDDVVAGLRGLELDVRGLMMVAPRGRAEEARPHFRWLAEKAAELGLRELSMGMSNDFEVAVEEGATIVRLGRALFGARPERAEVRR
jgi:PLP dependent protein